MKINKFIALNVLHFLFSIFLVLSFSVNISLCMMTFVPEIMIKSFNDSVLLNNNYLLKSMIIERLSDELHYDKVIIPATINYSIITILTIFIILVFFRLNYKEIKGLLPENEKNTEFEKCKKDIQNFLGINVNIKFTESLTFAAGREINISLPDLVKFLRNDKSVNFKLHHELHHILSMDSLLVLIHDPIINKFCLNVSALLMTGIALELVSRSLSQYYPSYLNLFVIILVFVSLKRILIPFRFSYRNIRECAADFYASQKTELTYQENFLVHERENEGIHLTYSERSCCCNGDIPYIWEAITFTFFLLFIFFNPFYSENIFITSMPYVMVVTGGLCCIAFISISRQQSNKLIKYCLVCFLLLALVYVKVLIINTVCLNFGFNYVKQCEAYELF